MMEGWIDRAIDNRWLMLVLAMVVCIAGGWAFFQQPIDAYPDISSEAVTIITTFSGRATEEVERQVTIPVEIAMRGVPRVQTTRSRTIFGLSVVQLIFEEGTEKYWARQRVMERLAALDLPAPAQASLGPLATAYGEVYRYELRSDDVPDLMTLREYNEWVVVPRLLRARGVAEVTNFGGIAKQFSVQVNSVQLRRYGLAFGDIVDAVQTNNVVAGGSVMRRGASSFVIRGSGALQTVNEIGGIFVKSIGGSPIYLRDVASIGLDGATRSGIFGRDDREEAVEGIVLMRRGENPSRVLADVKDAIDELNAIGLPPGMRIEVFYDRQALVDGTLATVMHSVSVGVLLVLLVLILFLGRPPLALIVAATIPFSLCFALVLMYLTNIPIGLLSIGAIDFGIIVDGAIIMAEYLAHRLGKHDRGMPTEVEIRAAANEMQRSTLYSVAMVIVAYLPLLSLRSIEGLLFRPMALTMVYALVGSLLFALFVVPPAIAIVYRHGYREFDNPLLTWATEAYGRLVGLLLGAKWLVLAASIVVVMVVSARVVPRLGFEFLPYMDEGVIWVRANFPEGTAIEQTSDFAGKIREIALEFEDVRFVSTQAGRNDSGTDPFPSSRVETMIGPYPREQWKQFRTKQQLIAALGARLRDEFPTTRFNFTQPIIDSVTEDTNGTSANLAVEISGADTESLIAVARKTVDVLRSVPGAVDVNIEQEGPQPQLVVTPDRVQCSRFDVRLEDVAELITTAVGAQPIGSLYEGERRFPIVARFDRTLVASPEALGRLPVFSRAGVAVPLAQVAAIEIKDGQTIVARQDGRRRLTVRADIVGRDQGGFVRDAQKAFDNAIKPPEGVGIAWLGMFENLTRAKNHFAIVMPITVVLIFALLWMTFRSTRAAFILLASVPLAFVGAAIGLYLRRMSLNVSTGVGFAALFGVSIMNGVLMVRAIAEQRANDLPVGKAIVQGAKNCLRPILLASLVAVLGLLPASLANGLGSDVQRPLATVIVWGLASAAALTLFVVPALYAALPPQE